MLQAINIHKKYGAVEVLKGIDLTLQSGEVSALVGKSGAGKSTLLQILGALDSPDSGELTFENRPLHKMNGMERARFRNERLGFVFQFHHLMPEFTALENICMPAFIRGENKKTAMDRGRVLMAELGIDHRETHKPSELSGGEQQRVAVARALINSPGLILADEPTGNLDSANRNAMMELFISLAQTRSVSFLIATHDEEVAAIANRVVRIVDGKIK